MYPYLRGGGTHIVFDVDPVCVGIGVGVSVGFGFGMTLFCLQISCEAVVEFLPNFHGYIIGT